MSKRGRGAYRVDGECWRLSLQESKSVQSEAWSGIDFSTPFYGWVSVRNWNPDKGGQGWRLDTKLLEINNLIGRSVDQCTESAVLKPWFVPTPENIFSGGWTVEHRSKESYLWFSCVPWNGVVDTLLSWSRQEWPLLPSLSLHFPCRPLAASSHLLCPGCTDSMTVDFPRHRMCKVSKHTQGRHPFPQPLGWLLPPQRRDIGCRHHWDGSGMKFWVTFLSTIIWLWFPWISLLILGRSCMPHIIQFAIPYLK